MNRSRTVYLSGRFVPESEAKISIFDSAVMLGDCVTESTRTFRHQPFRLDDHLRRMYRSLKVARIDPGLSVEEMRRVTLETLETNLDAMTDEEDCWIVHNVSRGEQRPGSDPRQRTEATVMIFTSPLDLRGWAEFYDRGCHAVVSMSRIAPGQSIDARVKNRSRMAYTIADAEARLVDPRAQCILLDVHGYVAENKGGNVFAVIDGVLKTPTTENCLAGVSRRTALDLASELDVPAVETRLLPYDLYAAEELFFTSTPYCILPATRFNGLPVGDGAVGPTTRRLLAAWSEKVGVDICAQARRQLSESEASPTQSPLITDRHPAE